MQRLFGALPNGHYWQRRKGRNELPPCKGIPDTICKRLLWHIHSSRWRASIDVQPVRYVLRTASWDSTGLGMVPSSRDELRADLAERTDASWLRTHSVSGLPGTSSLPSRGSRAPSNASAAFAATENFRAQAAMVTACKGLVRGLAQRANAARSFREQCSELLAQGNAASLALDTALRQQQGPALELQHLASQVQAGLTTALTLVDKYGHASRLEQLFRTTSGAEVGRKMAAAAANLGALAERIWDLITPDTPLKRSLMATQPRAGDARALGAALLDRRRLRPSCKRPLTALAVVPDGDEEDAYEGCVAWASSRGIKVTRVGPTISSVMDGSMEAPPVTALVGGSPGQLWSGHADGSVRLWAVGPGVAAACPVKVGNTPITALAWDPTTEHAWAGTADGEIRIVRVLLDGTSCGRLEVARGLLGQEAAAAAAVSSSAAYPHPPLPGGPAGVPMMQQGTGSSSSQGSHAGLLHQKAAAASETSGLRGSWELLESCLGSGSGSGRLRDHAVHQGSVVAICCRGGRAWSIGGSSPSTTELLVWDSSRYELLRVISKRATPHLTSPATCMALAATPRSNGSLATGGAGRELTLVTGHKDGCTLLWDISGDNARAMLAVVPPGRPAVRCLGVADQLGLLVVGHANGRVYLRQLDAAVARSQPPGGAQLPRWNPPSVSLLCHRLRLLHLAVGPHHIVSSGQSNSVKLWPEARLRTMAATGGLRMPPSQDMGVDATMRLLGASSSLASRLNSNTSTSASGQLHHEFSGGLAGTAGATRRGSGESADVSITGKAAAGAGGEEGGAAKEPVAVTATAGAGRVPPAQQQQQQGQEAAGFTVAATAAGATEPLPVSEDNNALVKWRKLRADGDKAFVLEWEALTRSGLHPIGNGSYGSVYKAVHNETDVAVKVLHGGEPAPGVDAAAGSRSGQVEWQKELASEVQVLARINHPNVVLFMGVVLSPPCVVTEYCAMNSLFEVLARARREPRLAGRLTWAMRINMALDTARGMLALHEHRALHTDLKSPNLFVDRSMKVKVGDFNLSRFLNTGDNFVESSNLVNPRWCAPEVIEKGKYSKAADVYSYGIILWELLTWLRPWEPIAVAAGSSSSSSSPALDSSRVSGLSGGPVNNFQIMNAVKGGARPPVLRDQLPGETPSPQLLQQYIKLMEDCWHQEPQQRPDFKSIMESLRMLLRLAAAGAGAAAAAAAGFRTAVPTAGGAGPTSRDLLGAATAPAIGNLINLDEEEGEPTAHSPSAPAVITTAAAPAPTTPPTPAGRQPAVPSKPSAPRLSPFANISAAAVVGDVSDPPAVAVNAPPAAVSPFAAQQVQLQPAGTNSSSRVVSPGVAGIQQPPSTAATQPAPQSPRPVVRPPSVDLLGDELPISVDVPSKPAVQAMAPKDAQPATANGHLPGSTGGSVWFPVPNSALGGPGLPHPVQPQQYYGTGGQPALWPNSWYPQPQMVSIVQQQNTASGLT